MGGLRGRSAIFSTIKLKKKKSHYCRKRAPAPTPRARPRAPSRSARPLTAGGAAALWAVSAEAHTGRGAPDLSGEGAPSGGGVAGAPWGGAQALACGALPGALGPARRFLRARRPLRPAAGPMAAKRVNLLLALVAATLFGFSCFCISKMTQTSKRRGQGGGGCFSLPLSGPPWLGWPLDCLAAGGSQRRGAGDVGPWRGRPRSW